MKQLEECIKGEISIDSISLSKIVDQFEKVELKKGEFFLKSGVICKSMAFISEGYLRMYDIVEDKEVTLWIGTVGQFITSVTSFTFMTKNLWNIQAITDCSLFVISRENHQTLTETQSKWLEFDNILLARSFALLEKSMFAQLHTTAKQRFDSLLEEQPELFNYVPLQFIASMLGIAPESLSRLRKNLSNTTS